MKTVSYKGYQASVEFDNGTLFVRVLHIDDLLLGECDKASEAEAVLKDLIDEYISDCKEIGKTPTKPFSGTFNVRVGQELHKRAAMAAASAGQSLNNWLIEATTEKLECANLADRFDHVVEDARYEMQLLKHVQVQAPRPPAPTARHIFTHGRTQDLISFAALHRESLSKYDG